MEVQLCRDHRPPALSGVEVEPEDPSRESSSRNGGMENAVRQSDHGILRSQPMDLASAETP